MCVFESNELGMTGRQIKVGHEQFRDLYVRSTVQYQGGQIKEDEMDGACSMNNRRYGCTQTFS